MNADDIVALSTNTLHALQPYLPILATKAAEKVGEEVPSAIKQLWQLLRTRLKQTPAATELLANIGEEPNDASMERAFQNQVAAILSQDDDFADLLSELVRRVAHENTYHAELHGSGALAQGSGNQAVGAAGVIINKKE